MYKLVLVSIVKESETQRIYSWLYELIMLLVFRFKSTEVQDEFSLMQVNVIHLALGSTGGMDFFSLKTSYSSCCP
jgi:hypothetical protein